MIYTAVVTPLVLSEFVEKYAEQDEAIRTFERGATAVASVIKPVGMIRAVTDYTGWGGADEALLRWNGVTYTLFANPLSAQIDAAGKVAMEADFNFNGHKGVGLANAVADTDAMPFLQAKQLIAGPWIAAVNAGGQEITNLGAPSGQQSAARLDDTWQATHGMGQQIAGFQMTDNGTEAATFQQILGGKNTDFAPRRVSLMFSGALTPTAGGGSVGALPQTEFSGMLWDADAGWKTIGTFNLGGFAYDVGIKRKTGSPRGVWVRILRQIGGASYQPASREIYAEYAVSQ